MLKSIIGYLKSGVLQYVFLRYFTFGLQFLSIMLIAKALGEHQYGIYSFILLVLQYYAYHNLGVNFSLNKSIAIKKSNEKLVKLLWGNAMLIGTICSFILLLVGALLYFFPIASLESKYNFSNYAIITSIIGVLTSYNNLFLIIYRIHGKLSKINLFQAIVPSAILLVAAFYWNSANVNHILFATVMAHLISLVVFIHKSPNPLRIIYNKLIFRSLVYRGFHLLMYNVSFYFILVSARTLVSVYYSVEELGYYTLANSFCIAVVLSGKAFSFIFFPKLINRFAKNTHNENIALIERIRSIYISLLNLVVILSLIILPVITYFIPEYRDILYVYKILIIAQIIFNNAFGYSTYLISSNKENILMRSGFMAIGTVLIIGYFFTLLGFGFQYIAVAVIFAALVYTFIVLYFANKKLNKYPVFFSLVRHEFPIRLLIPMMIITVAVIANENIYLPTLALIAFMWLNRNHIKGIVLEAKKVILDKNALNI